MGKNSMIRKALSIGHERHPDAGMDKIKDIMVGNIGFIFAHTGTTFDDVRETMQKFRVDAAAKAGQLSLVDLELPSGPTGMDPSQTGFFQALNIGTKIVKGQIELTAAFKILTTGKKVSASEQVLLNKLGVKPFNYGMEVKYVFQDSAVFDAAVLDISDSVLISKFMSGLANMAAFSREIGIPTEPAIPHAFGNAFKNVAALVGEIDFTFKEVEQVKKFLEDPSAYAAANPAPAAASGGGGGGAPAAKKEEAVEEEEEEDMEETEDMEEAEDMDEEEDMEEGSYEDEDDMEEGSYEEEDEEEMDMGDEGDDLESDDDDDMEEVIEITEEDDDEDMDEGEEGDDEEEVTAEEIVGEMVKLDRENKQLRKENARLSKAVKILNNRIDEVNLFNARLAATSELMRKVTLTKEEKERAIKILDSASSINEVKRSYKALYEGYRAGGRQVKSKNRVNRRPVHSVVTESAKRQVVQESTNEVDRLARLAGIQ
jgi:large subunit ribosomal protein LP0